MIHEASFSGVLRILFWIFAISFAIRLLARLALPHVMRKAEEKMRENMRRQQESQRPSRREGDVSIDSSKFDGKNKNDGEYVDYVEIKD
jgi:hypothetical protein